MSYHPKNIPFYRVCRVCHKKKVTRRSFEKKNDGKNRLASSYRYDCRACRISKLREWRIKHPPKYDKRLREIQLRSIKKRIQELEEIVYLILGDKCVRCGFADKRILEFDHVRNDGAKERMKKGRPGRYLILLWISRHPNSHRYQILCPNCNKLKEWERRHAQAK